MNCMRKFIIRSNKQKQLNVLEIYPIQPWTHDLYTYPHLSFFLVTPLLNVTKRNKNRNIVQFLYHKGHISVLADYLYFLWVCAIEIYTCTIYKIC